jgi:hypothetical protein
VQLAGLAAAGGLASSDGLATADAGAAGTQATPLAEVEVETAPGAEGGAGASAAAGAGGGAGGPGTAGATAKDAAFAAAARLRAAEAAAVRGARISVPEGTLVVTAGGSVVAAGPGGVEVAVGGASASAAVAIAVPYLPPGVEYAAPFILTLPTVADVLSSAGADGGASAAATVPEGLRCGVAATLHAVRAANAGGSSSSLGAPSPSAWLEAAAAAPHTLVSARAVSAVLARAPLSLACTLHPDPTSPVLDTTPLVRTSPFAGVPASALGRGGAGSGGGAGGSGAAAGAFVRSGTRFSARLVLSSSTGEAVSIRDARIVPASPAAAGAAAASAAGGVELVADDLREQLAGPGDAGAAALRDALARLLGSSAAAAAASAAVSGAAGGGVALQPGASAKASLVWRATAPGSYPLGSLELTVAVGSVPPSSSAEGGSHPLPVQTLRLPLPSVAIAAPPVRCDVSWPDSAVAKVPVQVSVRVTNATPHFHALEVSLQPPAAAVATAPGQVLTGTATQSALDAVSLSGVPAFEPLDRFTRYIVELLPGASKAVSFNVVAHQPGFTALPSVVVKATRTEGRAEARVVVGGLGIAPKQQAPAAGGPGGAPPTAAAAGGSLAPVPIAPPAPPGSEVMAVLPAGADGAPAPRGIFVAPAAAEQPQAASA